MHELYVTQKVTLLSLIATTVRSVQILQLILMSCHSERRIGPRPLFSSISSVFTDMQLILFPAIRRTVLRLHFASRPSRVLRFYFLVSFGTTNVMVFMNCKILIKKSSKQNPILGSLFAAH